MFGTRLKILREGDDLSQAKFAQEIGFSQSLLLLGKTEQENRV